MIFTGRRHKVSDQHLQEGRLARTVAADHADLFALGNGHVYVLQSPELVHRSREERRTNAKNIQRLIAQTAIEAIRLADVRERDRRRRASRYRNILCIVEEHRLGAHEGAPTKGKAKQPKHNTAGYCAKGRKGAEDHRAL